MTRAPAKDLMELQNINQHLELKLCGRSLDWRVLVLW